MTLIANQTLAETQARRNFASNLDSLSIAQPKLRQWVDDQALTVEWVFGTDRSLTARDEFGGWWSGCSLPGRAAHKLLENLEIKGAVACYLLPSHAAHLAAALEQLRPEQAIVVILPEHRDLAILLHCHDFAPAISAHRLWFAAGPAWDVELSDLFEQRPGLATPTQFIRTPDADAQQVQELISAAQSIFTEISNRRTTQLQSPPVTRSSAEPSGPRLCVVAPSRFRLWNDLAPAMLGGMDRSGIEIAHFDADDPLCSSPLALLHSVRQCSGIITANTGRGDLPGLAPETIPWITWVTASRIPTAALAGPRDHLLVADPRLVEAAIRAGWPKSRVHIATWPPSTTTISPPAGGSLALIADTCALDTPPDLIEYSSHSILWDAIREELLNDPFASGHEIATYLRSRMKRGRVAEDAFPTVRFLDKLIRPAYQQGIARVLLQAGLPLRLFGKGWESIPEFASHACGPVQSREHLEEIVSQQSALVHAWPTPLAHPIEFCGVPVLKAIGGTKNALLQQAQQALVGKLAAPAVEHPFIGPLMFAQILRSTCDSSSDNMS